MARSILRTRRCGLVRPGMLMIAVVAMVAVTSCAATSSSVNVWPRSFVPPWASIVGSLSSEQREYADDLALLSDPSTAAAFGLDPRLRGLTARQAKELAALRRTVVLWRSTLQPPR
jgi:hypothetical protein